MTEVEEFKSRIKVGRKHGSVCCNRIRKAYWELKKAKKLKVDCSTFSLILNTVAEVFWKKVYAGHSVAIPYLFNMEVIPNESIFTRSVNWKRTWDWWKEDNEAFKDRLLVRNMPTRFILRTRHSTISRRRNMWYYPLLFDIRPTRQRVIDIETKYELG